MEVVQLVLLKSLGVIESCGGIFGGIGVKSILQGSIEGSIVVVNFPFKFLFQLFLNSLLV